MEDETTRSPQEAMMAMPDDEAAAVVGDADDHPVAAAAAMAMKKTAWTKEEDLVLREQVKLHGAQNWAAISEAVPGRNPKSCRLRWCQHLSPTVETTKGFTPQEDDVVLECYHSYPKKWATIAGFLPGRTDNAVKNRWHSFLHKTYPQYLQQLQEKEQVKQQAAAAAAAVPVGVPRHRRRRRCLADGTLPLFPLAPGDVGGRGMSVPGLRFRHPPPPDGVDVEVDLSGECLELFPLVPGDLVVVRGDNAGEVEAAAMDVDESLLELWPSMNHQGDDGAGSSGGQDFLSQILACPLINY